MKLKFIISPLIIWGAGFFLTAQEPLQTELNMFRADDTLVKQQVEYKPQGRFGENILWDFGKLKILDNKYTVTYEQMYDSLLIGTEHQTRYYYELRNDSLFLTGYENPTTKIMYGLPELLLCFPLKLGDKFESHYQGNGTYCDKLDINAYGFTQSVVDASGMIILPDGDTLKHVTRVHTTKLISEKINPTQPDTTAFLFNDSLKLAILSTDSINHYLQTDSTVLKIDTYRWYAAGYRYPVFETILTGSAINNSKNPYFATAFFYAPQKHTYLESDNKNTSLQAELLKREELQKAATNNAKNNVEGSASINDIKFTYNYYPNPVESQLHFEYYLSEDAKVSFGLYGISGSMVYRSPSKNQRAGAHTEIFDMGYLSRGEYILTILVNNRPLSEKIIKK